MCDHCKPRRERERQSRNPADLATHPDPAATLAGDALVRATRPESGNEGSGGGTYDDSDSALLPLGLAAGFGVDVRGEGDRGAEGDASGDAEDCPLRYTLEPVRSAGGHAVAWGIVDTHGGRAIPGAVFSDFGAAAIRCARWNDGARLLGIDRPRLLRLSVVGRSGSPGEAGGDVPKEAPEEKAPPPTAARYSEPGDPMPWLPGDVVGLGPVVPPWPPGGDDDPGAEAERDALGPWGAVRASLVLLGIIAAAAAVAGAIGAGWM